jgi:hypothetical protein
VVRGNALLTDQQVNARFVGFDQPGREIDTTVKMIPISKLQLSGLEVKELILGFFVFLRSWRWACSERFRRGPICI